MKAFPASGQALDQQMADVNNVSALLAHFLKNNESTAIKMLEVYGVSMPVFATSGQVRVAFLKAIKDNEAFRADASKMLSSTIPTRPNKKEFVNQPAVALDFISQPAFHNFSEGDVWNAPADSTTGSTSGSSGSSSGGGFWSTLGGIFSKEVIQKGINTGLDALSSKLQANANKTTEKNALALEAERLKQLQTQLEIERARANQPLGAGMPTWAKWAIGVGVAAILLISVVVIVRKKRRAA